MQKQEGKTQHTAGPWYATGGNVLRDVRGRAMTVAECHVERDDKNRMEELAANANLIAAAPELLDALCTAEKQMSALASRGVCQLCGEAGDVSAWGQCHAPECALTITRAAIARAKGGQS